MQSSDPKASNPSDRQAKPVGFSRRQLLAGTPLAAFGVAVSGLNLGSVTSSAAAESTEKEKSAEAPVDLSRRPVRQSFGMRDDGGIEAKEEEPRRFHVRYRERWEGLDWWAAPPKRLRWLSS